MFYLILFYS